MSKSQLSEQIFFIQLKEEPQTRGGRRKLFKNTLKAYLKKWNTDYMEFAIIFYVSLNVGCKNLPSSFTDIITLICTSAKPDSNRTTNPFTVDVRVCDYYLGILKLINLSCLFPQIIFYEDRNFQGRHYECSNDCADLSPYFSRCNSMRVMSDWWVMYERPNYMGYQYVLSRGEYPDYQRWMGFNDNIGSCRTYPYYRGGNYRMRIYERPDFGGQMMEFMDDCPSVYDRFRYRDIHSCHVMDGYWNFYEHPNYRGRQYFMRPGEYRRYSDWGGFNSTIGSFRRMRDF
ncbi:gamma-crystallin S-1-like [Scyliorhinus torazame]|uniref:gamma-crystallin S-1-like n=1 Tax=Scyliorhinus torazame TaxID=75743 RepID=UPI003B5CCC5E